MTDILIPVREPRSRKISGRRVAIFIAPSTTPVKELKLKEPDTIPQSSGIFFIPGLQKNYILLFPIRFSGTRNTPYLFSCCCAFAYDFSISLLPCPQSFLKLPLSVHSNCLSLFLLFPSSLLQKH